MSGRKGEGRTGGGASFRKEKNELAEDMVKENQFKYKRDSIKEIRQFIQKSNDTKDGIKINDEGEIETSKEVTERADKLAKKLADRIEFTDKEAQDSYDELRSALSGKFYISPEDAKEFDERRKFMKNSLVKVVTHRVVTDPNNPNKNIRATPIDSIYSELYNNGENSWGLTNPNGSAAKLIELNDMLRYQKSQIKYGIYSDKGRAELRGATPEQVIREIRSQLIENAAIAQVLYKDTRSRRKKK